MRAYYKKKPINSNNEKLLKIIYFKNNQKKLKIIYFQFFFWKYVFSRSALFNCGRTQNCGRTDARRRINVHGGPLSSFPGIRVLRTPVLLSRNTCGYISFLFGSEAFFMNDYSILYLFTMLYDCNMANVIIVISRFYIYIYIYIYIVFIWSTSKLM